VWRNRLKCFNQIRKKGNCVLLDSWGRYVRGDRHKAHQREVFTGSEPNPLNASWSGCEGKEKNLIHRCRLKMALLKNTLDCAGSKRYRGLVRPGGNSSYEAELVITLRLNKRGQNGSEWQEANREGQIKSKRDTVNQKKTRTFTKQRWNPDET